MYVFEDKTVSLSGKPINMPVLVAHCFYRNGIVENYHAENAVVDKKVFRAVMKDTANRVYYFMKLRDEFIEAAKSNDVEVVN